MNRKLISKSPRFVPFGDNLAQFEGESDLPGGTSQWFLYLDTRVKARCGRKRYVAILSVFSHILTDAKKKEANWFNCSGNGTHVHFSLNDIATQFRRVYFRLCMSEVSMNDLTTNSCMELTSSSQNKRYVHKPNKSYDWSNSSFLPRWCQLLWQLRGISFILGDEFLTHKSIIRSSSICAFHWVQQ